MPISVSAAVIRLSKPVSSMSWMASTSLVDRLTTRPDVYRSWNAMSNRWKCRNTRRRSSSSTFWPIRPERCRKNIRLTAWTSTTTHSTPTMTISVCAEPPDRIGGMPWSMPRCTSSGTERRARFSTTTTSARSATVTR